MAVNKESYYMVIPSKIWDSKLDAKSILMYGHITVLANKGGFCYANNKYFERVLDISTSTVVRKLNELESLNFIKRSIIYDDDKKTVKERRIYLNTGSIMDEHRAIITDEHRAIVTSEQDNTTRNNNTRDNIIDVPSEDNIKGKIFFKIVDLYPKNRIGNRQHGLKKFKTLDIDQAKLAATNLKRYLKVAGQYVKNLQNYITEECWSEEWLVAEETKLKKQSKTDINTKTFKAQYGNI